MKKEKYVTPSIEVMEVDHEGVMAASPGKDFDYGGGLSGGNGNVGTNRTYYDTGIARDIEDMVSNLFTVEP